MIEVQKLVKRYGDRLAVDGLSFGVEKGEIVGFLGPNGAGKSTTLRILSGFLGMTSGKVTVAGFDVRERGFEARQNIGYMPEAVPLYGEMRVFEYLTFRAELKRVPRRERASAVEQAMAKAKVDDVASVLIGKLSKGYKQRVGLADALVAKPPLLILDEPTAGLDPNQVLDVRELIRSLGKEHTVLLSTHILSEVEASCSRVVVIAKGKLVAEGTMEALARKRRSSGLLVVVRGDAGAALRVLRGVEGIARAELDGGARGSERPPSREPHESVEPGEPREPREGATASVRCTFGKKVDEAAIARATERAVAELVAAGCFVREVRPVRSSLEEVFAELTRDAAPSSPDATDATDASSSTTEEAP